MMRRLATAALVVGFLGMAPAADAKPAKLRQCGFLEDPTPALFYAQGAVSCRTAKRVTVRAIAQAQYGNHSWRTRVGGRTWRCSASSRRAVYFECKRPGSVVSLREG
jgi:hypothetical protein